MEELLNLVGNFSFPIVLSTYLLVRIEGELKQRFTSMTEIFKAVAVRES
ncbi:MAG TPA: YvrJ family protein [Desulfosporosinus sp.]|jgi:hypothetical protein|nr:YvrJ family protein [Desulfosporosinus sp.]